MVQVLILRRRAGNSPDYFVTRVGGSLLMWPSANTQLQKVDFQQVLLLHCVVLLETDLDIVDSVRPAGPAGERGSAGACNRGLGGSVYSGPRASDPSFFSLVSIIVNRYLVIIALSSLCLSS